MIIHLPHAATDLPDRYLGQFQLTDAELTAELLCMTDWYTDELFAWSATSVRFPFSRLLVDVERFADDHQEPMAERGMGAPFGSALSFDAMVSYLHEALAQLPDKRTGQNTIYIAPHLVRLDRRYGGRDPGHQTPPWQARFVGWLTYV